MVRLFALNESPGDGARPSCLRVQCAGHSSRSVVLWCLRPLLFGVSVTQCRDLLNTLCFFGPALHQGLEGHNMFEELAQQRDCLCNPLSTVSRLMMVFGVCNPRTLPLNKGTLL